MKWSGTTKSNQRKITRVITLLDRHQAKRTKHRLVNNFNDPFSGHHQIDTHGIGNALDRGD